MMTRHGGRHGLTTSVTSLANLPSGSRCIVAASSPPLPGHGHRHGACPATTGRLAALGFVPGVSLTVEANYGSGPVIVHIKGARVAIGRGQAGRLMVLPQPGGSPVEGDGVAPKSQRWPSFTPASEE
jgi:Fe2+ transport system protein FeoA